MWIYHSTNIIIDTVQCIRFTYCFYDIDIWINSIFRKSAHGRLQFFRKSAHVFNSLFFFCFYFCFFYDEIQMIKYIDIDIK